MLSVIKQGREVKNKMEKLQFYDLKGRKKFMSAEYKKVTKKGRIFAVCKAPSGIQSWRIIGAVKKK